MTTSDLLLTFPILCHNNDKVQKKQATDAPPHFHCSTDTGSLSAHTLAAPMPFLQYSQPAKKVQSYSQPLTKGIVVLCHMREHVKFPTAQDSNSYFSCCSATKHTAMASGGAGGRGVRERGGKWEQPGWRIEQKYSQGVLIGNWSEDRLGKVSCYVTLRKNLWQINLRRLCIFLNIFLVSERKRVW